MSLQRSNSYQNKDAFFQKLLYKINGKTTITIIADELTKLLNLSPENKIISSQKPDGSLYLEYPDFGMIDNWGNQMILNYFHLSLHTGKTGIINSMQHLTNDKEGEINYEVVEINRKTERVKVQYHDKIHFRFNLQNINQRISNEIITKNYIYPLVQNDNLLSPKQLNSRKKIIKGSIIYTSFNNNINELMEKTITTIQDHLDIAQKHIENDNLLRRTMYESSRIKSLVPIFKKGGSKEKNKLNSIKTKYLREYCKKNKLKGYSEYNKKDLINFIKNNVTKKLT